MPPVPFEWNVVVVGAWNLAILTPHGIAQRLFRLPLGSGVEVQVAVDELGPMRVLHGGLMVVPAARQLMVQPENATLAGLARAAEIAVNAIRGLPETPMSAAGVNIRYRFDALSDDLLDAGRSQWLDDRLAHGDYQINSRVLKRALRWQVGTLNLELVENNDASGLLSMNFHCASNDVDTLAQWVGDVAQMHAQAMRMMETLNIRIGAET